MFLSTLFSFVIIFTSTFSARILGIASVPSYSHQIVFRPIWKELSARGHQLVLVTTDPMGDPKLKNIKEIDTSNSYKLQERFNMNKLSKLSLLDMVDRFIYLGYDLIEEQLLHPEIQQLLKNETEHFDLLIVEYFYPAMAAFAERFKCPLTQIVSREAGAANYRSLGNPVHPILYPDFTLAFPERLNFVQRLQSIWNVLIMKYAGYRFSRVHDELVRKHFGVDYPPLKNILDRTSLMFVNTDIIFHKPRPLMPNIIQYGGGTHLTPPKPLPKDLQLLLDKATRGFIYFSLGSNLKSKRLSENIKKTLIDTFSELPYTILWKFEEEDLLSKPDNVVISEWFPQQDILRHPNIKLFITQGGLQSLEEAAYNHVPMVGIPFYGDQKSNIQRMVNKGMALLVNHETMDKTALKEAILEVINNPSYRKNAKELAELAKDQPMTGLERAIWWTEYVIRHKGAPHLRSPAMDIPTYQYYLLDIIGFCLLVVLVVLYIFVTLVKLVFKIMKYLLTKSKIKTQ